MEEREIRDRQVSQLLTRVINPEGVNEEELFEELCLYSRDGDIETVYAVLAKKRDMSNIYWLIRYLVEIERPIGFDKLFELALSDDEFIRERAAYGIAGIAADVRIEFFIRMLDFRWEKQVLFAANALAKSRAPQAALPLVSAMEKHRENEDICLAVIKALGNINDRQALVSLERIAVKAEGKVKEEAAKSLSKLIRLFSSMHLKRYIDSDNPSIRAIAYHIAANMMTKRGEQYLMRGFDAEKEERIKLEMLSWIKTIMTQGLFRSVFNMISSDGSRAVRKSARSAIRMARSAAVLKCLIRMWGKADVKGRMIILELLADYNNMGEVIDFLVASYRRSDDSILKLVAIESLGGITAGGRAGLTGKPAKAASFLKGVILERNAYSYAAAVSLASIVGPKDWRMIGEMLSMDGTGFHSVAQVFLQLIFCLPDSYEIPEEIQRHIRKLMVSISPDVQYLAVRCLSKIRSNNTVDDLLLALRTDTSAYARDAYIRSLTDVLLKNTDELLKLLRRFRRDGEIKPFYYRIFKNVEKTKTNFERIIKTILGLIVEARSNPSPKNEAYASRLLVLLGVQALNDRSFFLEYLRYDTASDEERWCMLKVLNTTDIHRFGSISIDFMAEGYAQASSETKIEYLYFFQKTLTESEPVKDVIFESLYSESDELVRAEIEKTVSIWMAGTGEGVRTL